MSRAYTFSGEQLQLDLDAAPEADEQLDLSDPRQARAQAAAAEAALVQAAALVALLDAQAAARREAERDLAAVLEWAEQNGGIYELLRRVEARRASTQTAH